MALSRHFHCSKPYGMPSAANIIAAATVGEPSLPRRVILTAVPEQNDELVKMRADMVCSGCRCGWLCCECYLGCLSCKQRSRFCYCRLVSDSLTGDVLRVQCEICTDLRRSCQCHLTYRCKWCVVSLGACKQGGCTRLLPDRMSREAIPYVNIFSLEEDKDEGDCTEMEEKVADKMLEDDDSDKMSNASNQSCNVSLMSWSPDSADTSLSSSAWSVATEHPEELWECQQGRCQSGLANSDAEENRYGSTYSISSATSGGSFSSVGNKSDF